MAKMQPVHVPRTLPVVLSREEVSRLIAAAWNLKHQTALSVGHAQGKILRNGWLFPGLDPMDPLSTRQLNRAIHAHRPQPALLRLRALWRGHDHLAKLHAQAVDPRTTRACACAMTTHAQYRFNRRLTWRSMPSACAAMPTIAIVP